jgi:hypothetical protein
MNSYFGATCLGLTPRTGIYPKCLRLSRRLPPKIEALQVIMLWNFPTPPRSFAFWLFPLTVHVHAPLNFLPEPRRPPESWDPNILVTSMRRTFVTLAMLEPAVPTTRICTEALATDLKPDKEANCYTNVACDRNVTAYGHAGITLRPCSPANLVLVPERQLRIAPRAPEVNVLRDSSSVNHGH